MKIKDGAEIQAEIPVTQIGYWHRFKRTGMGRYEYRGSQVRMSVELTGITNMSNLLDHLGIAHKREDEFYDEELMDYDFGEYFDYEGYLDTLMPETLENLDEVQIEDLFGETAFLEIWI